MSNEDIGARLDRIEQRLAAYEVAARHIVERLEVQSVQLERLIRATTSEPENSPATAALRDLAGAMRAQAEAIEALPETLGAFVTERIREELYEEGFDPEQPARPGGVDLDGEDPA